MCSGLCLMSYTGCICICIRQSGKQWWQRIADIVYLFERKRFLSQFKTINIMFCSVPFHSVLFCECIIHSYVNQCKNPKSLCKLTNFNFRNGVCTMEYLKSRLVHIWRILLPRGGFFFITRNEASKIHLRFTVRFEDSSIKSKENRLKFLRFFQCDVGPIFLREKNCKIYVMSLF